MKKRILLWLAKRYPKTLVEIYAMVQTDFKRNFVISATKVDTKKGKNKMTLLFVETKTGAWKLWLTNGIVNIDEHPAFLKES